LLLILYNIDNQYFEMSFIPTCRMAAPYCLEGKAQR